ncbi:MAG TPA: hypothetical protein VK525_15090 [Candidatus Saccharimonadales bacterium]|nr:hypothetical protein [Candidatus Saccharimonadales bacterium]
MADNKIRCHCKRCTIRSLMGPAVIITIGIIFLIDQTHGGFFQFMKLLPVLLIVIGSILLASALAPMEGHTFASVPPSAPPGTPGVSPTIQQPPYSGQGQ